MMPPAAIPFVNPAFLWAGLGLALIPIAIYILNRRRYRTVAWAAMRFLLAANRKTMRRTRLEQLLLMALRITLLLLLGLAMSRPFLQFGAAPAVLAQGTHHVFVLDDSFSLSALIAPRDASEPDRNAFEMQIEFAHRLLQVLPTSDPVSFLWMGYPARQINRKPIFDRALASRLLKTAKPGHGHSDLIGALRRVRDVIASNQVEYPRHTVYLFSDFARPTLQPAATPALSTQFPAQVDPARGESSTTAAARESLKSLAHEITQSATLVLHDIYDHDTSNLANTHLAPRTNLVGAGEVAELVNTVTNLSMQRSAESTVRIAVDGKEVREFTLAPLEAGEAKSLTFALEFESPGLHVLQSNLSTESGDVLQRDNTRLVVVEARERFQVLAELPSHDLNSMDVVALCNVKQLSEATWRRLERFVQEGGGLVLFLGDLVDLEHYNSAAGDLLPSRLIEPAFVEVSESNLVHFAPDTLSEPLKVDFEGRPGSGLFRANVHQYIKMAAAMDTGHALVSYTSGDPAIVERQIGAGRCIVISTTANMEWTNLPAKGDFITLVMNLVQHVAPEGAAKRNFTVGDSYAEDISVISAGGEDYLIRRPDGTDAQLAIETLQGEGAGAGGFRLRFDALDQAGEYRLHTPRVEDPLSVNLNPIESELTPLTEDEIRRAFDCDLEYIVARATDDEWIGGGRSEFASMLVYAVLLLLMAETLMAMWFDHERQGHVSKGPGATGHEAH
jgi:hypothetical protein